MCYYITGIISSGIDFEKVNLVAKDFSLYLEPLVCSKTVQQYLRNDEVYCWNTRGGCACGTDIGMFITDEERKNAQIREEREIQRKRNQKSKKGWSQAKLDRWEQQKQNHRIYTPDVPGHDCENWTNFVRELFKALPVKKLGLMKHWYNHRIDSEEFEVHRTILYSNHLLPKTLHSMPQDELYIFINK